MGKLKRIAKEYDRLYAEMKRIRDDWGDFVSGDYHKRCMDVISGMDFVLHEMGYKRICDDGKEIIVRR